MQSIQLLARRLLEFLGASGPVTRNLEIRGAEIGTARKVRGLLLLLQPETDQNVDFLGQ